MTDEQRGRAWCEANAYRPEWYEPLGKWHLPLKPGVVAISLGWFDSESDAYAAVGRYFREMDEANKVADARKSPADYVAKMKAIAAISDGDTESCHQQADDLLCELLEKIGYGEVVAAYRDVSKWFA